MSKDLKTTPDDVLIANVKRDGCNDSFSELSERYQNLFYKICHRYTPAIRAMGWNPEEVFFEKDHTIFECIMKFDPTRGVKFSTWTGNYTRYLCLSLINKKKKFVEIDGDPSLNFINDVEQVHIFQNDERGDCLENVSYYFDGLSDRRHKKVLKLRYFSESPLTWKQIAKEMNISVQTAISLHNRALQTLKNKIKDKDNL